MKLIQGIFLKILKSEVILKFTTSKAKQIYKKKRKRIKRLTGMDHIDRKSHLIALFIHCELRMITIP